MHEFRSFDPGDQSGGGAANGDRAMFREHRDAAGLPAIRLHDARRTAATLLHTAYDVPADAAASYLGHDPVTYHRTYVVGETGRDKVRDALRQMQTGTDA